MLQLLQELDGDLVYRLGELGEPLLAGLVRPTDGAQIAQVKYSGNVVVTLAVAFAFAVAVAASS